LDHWHTLGIPCTPDQKRVKRAYAKLLKQHKPEQDPEGYQHLRQAFDWAIQYCKDARASGPSPSIEVETHEYIPEPFDNTAAEALQKTQEKQLAWKRQQIAEAKIADQRALEQENARRSDNEAQQQHYVSSVASLHQRIFAVQDPPQAINAFSMALGSDVLLNLKCRKMFERLCFETAVTWAGPRAFPSQLFEQIALEFEWLAMLPTDPYFAQHIAFIRQRIVVGLQYRALVERSEAGAFLSQQSAEIAVARLLLGEFRPAYFRALAFFNRHHKFIVEVIDTFTKQYSLTHCPELDTETFRWWIRYRHQHTYAIAHIFLGAIMALSVVLWFLEKSSIQLEGAVITAFMGASTLLFSLLSWWVIRLCLRLWVIIKSRYAEFQSLLQCSPFMHLSLMAIYTLMFLSPGLIDEKMVTTALFLCGGMLVYMLVGEAFLFVGFAAVTCMVVQANYEVVLPAALDNLFVFIGIASYYLWNGVVKKAPPIVSNMLTYNNISIIASLVLLAAQLSFSILYILNIKTYM